MVKSERINNWVVRADTPDWEQYVMCEVLIPDTPNAYGDIMSAELVRDAAYQFARQGYGIDVEHDKADVTGQDAVVVESFIAREGDPEFIPGSWVVGMKILSADLWQKILSGEINGYSYQADVLMSPVIIQNTGNRTVSGVTEPDPFDGHTHAYTVVIDSLNKPVSGGTSETDGHSHTITTHTFTGVSQQHRHRYQVITNDQGASDE